jgi:hypothetical protein
MTNASAMTALKTLNATNKSLSTTQSRISTGYRVAEASDNAAYWSIATTMRSDNKALTTVKDALGLGAAKVDTAYTGVKAAIDVVDEIKTKLVAAREPGVDRAKVQAEITQLQGQLAVKRVRIVLLGRKLVVGRLVGCRLQSVQVDRVVVYPLCFGRRFGWHHFGRYGKHQAL